MGTTVIMFGSILRALSFLFCVSTYFLLDLLERGTVSPLVHNELWIWNSRLLDVSFSLQKSSDTSGPKPK